MFRADRAAVLLPAVIAEHRIPRQTRRPTAAHGGPRQPTAAHGSPRQPTAAHGITEAAARVVARCLGPESSSAAMAPPLLALEPDFPKECHAQIPKRGNCSPEGHSFC